MPREDLLRDLVVRAITEEGALREELPEHDARSEHVDPLIDRSTPDLFWRGVLELALERSDARQARRGFALRYTEVADLHLTLHRKEDVVRRDVSVDHAKWFAAFVSKLVHVHQSLERFADHVHREPRRDSKAELGRSAEKRVKVDALHQLHHQIVLTAFATLEAVDLHHVFVPRTRR